MTATFLSCLLFNMLLKTVVLPAPRNPDSTVTGSLEILVSCIKIVLQIRTYKSDFTIKKIINS